MIRKTYTGITACFPANAADPDTLKYALACYGYIIPANSVIDWPKFYDLIDCHFSGGNPVIIAVLAAIRDASVKTINCYEPVDHE